MSSGGSDTFNATCNCGNTKPPDQLGYYEQSVSRTVITIAFFTVTIYNGIELLISIFIRFKRFKGCYFTSLVVTTIAVMANPLITSLFMKFSGPPLKKTQLYTCMAFGYTSWIFLVNGHSMILWSRLHFVLNSRRTLRRLLIMIIVNGVILCTVTTIVGTGANVASGSLQRSFNQGYKIIEKVQVTIFFIQEDLLSGIYVWKSAVLLRTNPRGDSRRLIVQLFGVNLVIIAMNVGVLVIEYANNYLLQVTVKAFVYSLKLKLEFSILTQLVRYISEPVKLARVPSNPSASRWQTLPGNDKGLPKMLDAEDVPCRGQDS